MDDIIFPDAQAREDDGKRPSQAVFDAMAQVNLIAMRLGPGKHLEGRVLMNGIVKPEEVSISSRLQVKCVTKVAHVAPVRPIPRAHHLARAWALTCPRI